MNDPTRPQLPTAPGGATPRRGRAAPLRIGVSACLIGQNVRYDGGHRHDSLLTAVLGPWVEWVPVCPEVEIGLGAPRETMELRGAAASPRLVTTRSGIDRTGAMAQWARRRLDELDALDLHGFVLKKGSPSCGLERVPVRPGPGKPPRSGRGLFAAALLARFPLLPVEEEGRLRYPALRENFIERAFALERWRRFRAARPGPRDLAAFHARERLTLLAHDGSAHRRLGRLVARAGSEPFSARLDRYGAGFLAALAAPATPARHAGVLRRLAGILRHDLDRVDREELRDRIAAFRRQRVPLVVPLTLLQHHFRRHPVTQVLEQSYLNPYPAELALRLSA